ncbi:MAG TPA: TatA/E family twin arginine-targeting protein translocase [Nitrospirota bacterium]|jgi:sec-independent protein translocase protein TatA|nr:TatA/E family twin arginine-targeting protein translocase [Nitrospirota bacterium]
MFGLGFGELLVIFVIALVVFGPKKLPEIGRSVGRALMEFKKASQEFQEAMHEEMKEVEKTAQLDEIKKLGNIQLPDYYEPASTGVPETQGEGQKTEQKPEEHKGEETKANG